MFTIQLKNVEFKSFHGLYPEEKKLGGIFVVNLTVHFNIYNTSSISLNKTVDYEHLFRIVEGRMNTPTELLETIVVELCNTIIQKFSSVDEVEISISKKNPPIKNMIGDVTVAYQQKRS